MLQSQNVYFKLLSNKCFYLQVVVCTVFFIFDIKTAKYQHDFSFRWRYDCVVTVFLITVIFRIVRRFNGANHICEYLLVQSSSSQ